MAAVNIDEVLSGSGRSGIAILTTPVAAIRESEHVRLNQSVRVNRHIVIVPTTQTGRHEVDGALHVFEPGQIVHIQPGQVHRWLPQETFEGHAIAIESHVCPPGLFDLSAPSPVVTLGMSLDVAHALISSLTEPEILPARAQRQLRISIASVLLELIAGATEAPTVPSELSNEYALVADFRRELEFHYLETRSVGDYASFVGCSAKTLTRATNRVLGQTPKQIIDARVIFAATRLLANTDISISWISSKLGFTQQSNFAKFFHRHVGVTPASYRATAAQDARGLSKSTVS